MLAPLAPPADTITHVHTLDLIRALHDANWLVREIGVNWAVLYHPAADQTIRVEMPMDDTSRLDRVLLGDREVPFRHAIAYARSWRT